VTGNAVFNNTSNSSNGAGLHVSGNSPGVWIDANRFTGNSAGGQGSALYLSGASNLRLTNNFVSAPPTLTTNSEIYVTGGALQALHNTLAGRGTGTGVYLDGGASGVFTNNLAIRPRSACARRAR
jgi:hypothetical protein